MSAVINVGIGGDFDRDTVEECITIELRTTSRSVQLYVSNSLEYLGSTEFLDELGDALNDAILWKKELLGLPEIQVDDSVKDFAEEVEEGLSRKVAKLLNESKIMEVEK